MIDHALALAAHGFYVFPLTKKQKIPVRGSRGFYDATTDASTIKKMFGHDPEYNVAIYPGSSGHLVIDLDTKDYANGIEEWEYLEQTNEPAPTLTAITPSGGRHLYYSLPPNTKIKSNSNQLAPGVDIRSHHGYVVAPPSLTASGAYYWDTDSCEPELDKIATAPRWLLGLCQHANGNATRIPVAPLESIPLTENQHKEIASALSAIGSDDYHQWVQVGMALKSTGAGNEALKLWLDWSSTSAKFDEQKSIRKWQTFDEWGDTTIATLFYLAKEAGWKEPAVTIELPTRIDVPNVVTDYTPPPGALRDIYQWSLETAYRPQPVISLAAAISFASLVLGRLYRADRTELNFYTVVLAPTAAGKDHALTTVATLAKFCDLSELLGQRVFSGQAIAKAMEGTCKRLYVMDEFGITMQRGGDNSISFIQALLDLYTSSGRLYVGADYADRKANHTIQMERPCLSLLALSTQSTFFDAVRSGAVQSGFMPRFLVLETDERPPKRRPPQKDPPQSVISWAKMRTIDGPLANQSNLSPIEIGRSDQAERVLAAFDEECEQVADNADAENTTSLWVRASQLAERLAAIAAGASYSIVPRIEQEHAIWAVSIVRDRVRSAAICLDENISDSDYHGKLNDVLAVFKARGERGISAGEEKRGLMRRLLQKYQPKEQTILVRDLMSMGKLVRYHHQPSGGGRPTERTVHWSFYLDASGTDDE